MGQLVPQHLMLKALKYIAFPLGGARGPIYRVQYIVFDTFDPFDVSVLCMQCCIKAANTTFDSFDLSNMSNN